LRLHFMGNYNEPHREFYANFGQGERKEKVYRFEFRLSKPNWDVIEEK
jgi:hypothetical protein